jgi:4-amino-4-deoxy-L-arabinose transferase-like glycosyltransferase
MINGKKTSTRYVLPALALFALLSVSTIMVWPPPWSDESVFGDAIFTLSHEGRLASTFVSGFERGAYWQPPLWFLVEAVAVHWAGHELLTLRVTSLIFAGLILVLLFRLGVVATGSVRTGSIAAFVLALNPLFVHQIKLARMDALCMVFVLFGSLMYLEYQQQRRRFFVHATGAAFAFAVLTHPLGLLGLIGVVIHQAQRKDQPTGERIRNCLWVSMPTVVVAGVLFAMAASDFPSFERQIQFQFGRKWGDVGGKAAYFVSRYSSIPAFLLIPIAGLFELWRESRDPSANNVRIVFLLGILSALIVAATFIAPYSVYYLPFVCVGAGRFISRIIAHGSRRARWFTAVASAMVVVNAVMHYWVLYASLVPVSPTDNYDDITRLVEPHLRRGSTVCIVGYPDLYFGLRKERPDLHLVSNLFIDSAAGEFAMSRINHIVISRTFDLSADSISTSFELAKLETIAAQQHKAILATGSLGVFRRYHASASTFDVVSISDVRVP